MGELTVGRFYKEQKDVLRLELITGEKALGRKITVAEVNRPGLALGGHLGHFRSERVQIIGRGEQAYLLQTDDGKVSKNLARMLAAQDIPCLILTRSLRTPPILSQACRKFGVPLLRTSLDTASFVGEMYAFLEGYLSPVTRVHGVLVDVYGLGVLIEGDSGIGKSECALELLKRGHILVSDDVVEVQQRRGGALVGNCPEPLKHYIEVRGLGILDVKLLFGVGSILDRARIELVARLEAWGGGGGEDRVGLEMRTTKIMDVEVPLIRIPVSPGRNLAVLIEVAALNQRLKAQGYFSAETFNRRLIERMRHK